MQQEKSDKILRIISFVINPIITFFLFIGLGSFYIADKHNPVLNTFVWLLMFFFAYYIYYVFALLITSKLHLKVRPLYFDGWCIFFNSVAILVICLFRSIRTSDYLYVEIYGFVTGFIGFFDLIYQVLKNKKKN